MPPAFSRILHSIRAVFPVILGNFLYALTVKLFLLPSGLVSGGSTGIALCVEHFFGIPISGFVLFFNLIMLFLGLAFLGKAFALTTLASTFLYPLSLELCNFLLGDLCLTGDLLLCTIFSGIGIGISLGIVIRSGASTGGMDIPPLILQKLLHIPISVSLYAFDVCILLLQALFRPAENILYGILLVLVYTIVLDRTLMIGNARTEVKIISQKSEEISQAILHQLDRGVTLLSGKSGYFHNETQLVLSVISHRELFRLEKIVRQIDPEAFMIISRVSEVRGRGFSMNKQYQ